MVSHMATMRFPLNILYVKGNHRNHIYGVSRVSMRSNADVVTVHWKLSHGFSWFLTAVTIGLPRDNYVMRPMTLQMTSVI